MLLSHALHIIDPARKRVTSGGSIDQLQQLSRPTERRRSLVAPITTGILGRRSLSSSIMSSPLHLNDFPPELLGKIFWHLTVPDILALKLVGPATIFSSESVE